MSMFTQKKIREVYWKSCSHEGFLNIYIYRKLSIRLAVLAAHLRWSPNQVTILAFIASMVAILLFVPGNYALAVWALIPFHIGKILDCADGQLAKLTGQQSALGAFLDPFFDRVVDLAMLVALAFAYYQNTGSHVALYLTFAFTAVWYFAAYLDKHSDASATSLESLRSTTKGLPEGLRRLLKWDGGFTGLVVTLAVVFQQIPALIVLFLVVAALPVPMQLMALLRRLRTAQ